MAISQKLARRGSPGDTTKCVAIPGARTQLPSGDYITGQEAELNTLDYLRRYPGKQLPLWTVITKLSASDDWRDKPVKRRFYLLQIDRLIAEGKVKRCRKLMKRGSIRINEAYVKS